MKYLNDYTQDAISKVMDDNGGFFAFSDSQFDENKKEGVTYCHLYGGLIAPKESANTIIFALDEATQRGIKQDVKENGIKAIIWRELANYESQISRTCEDTIDALSDYPTTKGEIVKEFKLYMTHCIDNDLF